MATAWLFHPLVTSFKPPNVCKNSPKLYNTLNSVVLPSHSHNVQGSSMSAELPYPEKVIPKEGLQHDPASTFSQWMENERMEREYFFFSDLAQR